MSEEEQEFFTSLCTMHPFDPLPRGKAYRPLFSERKCFELKGFKGNHLYLNTVIKLFLNCGTVTHTLYNKIQVAGLSSGYH